RHKLPQRTTYDGKKLPKSLADCDKKKDDKKKQRKAENPSGPVCRGVNGCGSSNGDPHLITLDGLFYDFQAVGEFVAVAASTPDLRIQVRQAPLPYSRTVAINTAVAMQVSTTRLGFYAEQGVTTVRRDGQPVSVPVGDTNLPGGATLTRYTHPYRGVSYVVRWPDRTVAWIEPVGAYGLHLTVDAAPSRQGTVTGLLGNFDGNKDNDLATSTGSTLPVPAPFEQLYPGYADSWRITAATTLFDYPAGKDTNAFTDRTFPDRAATPADLPAAARAAARSACQQLGITEPAVLDACTLDLALTGQPLFALGAADAQTALPVTTEVSVPTTVSIGSPGGIAQTTFDGEAGRRVYVDVRSQGLPDQCGVLALKAASGRMLAGGCLRAGQGEIDGTLLPDTGTYTIVVDPAGDATGTATVTITSTVDQVATVAADGPPVTLTIPAAGAVARAMFSATAGSRIYLEITGSTLPDQCGVPVVVGPSGSAVDIGCLRGPTVTLDAITLASTGQYRIEVDPAGAGTGQLTVRLRSTQNQAGTIVIGGPPVTAVIDQADGVAKYSFTATAGQKIFVDVSGSTFPDQCGLPELRGVGGYPVGLGCVKGATGFLDGLILRDTGQYTLVVDPNGTATGQATMRIIAVQDQQSTITVGGPEVTTTIAQPGGVATLTFTGAAGQKVTVEIVSSTLPDQCGLPGLRDPSGREIDFGCVKAGTGTLTLTLPSSGQYAIVIDPAARAVGQTRIRLRT
ncbi:MAG TPA: VWD domain-containing protein, partial [Micromonosporaceae bacterium]